VPLTDLLTADAIDWTNKLLGKHEKDFNYDYLSGVDYGYEFDSGDETLEEHQLVGDSLFDVYNYAGTVRTRLELPDYSGQNTAPHENEIWYVKSESRYFVFNRTRIDVPPFGFNYWDPLTYDLFRMKTGDKKREKQSRLSTLASDYTTSGPLGDDYRLSPRSDQSIVEKEGFNKYFDITRPWLSFNSDYIKDINPRLLFYRGMLYVGDDYNYPYANYHEYNPNGFEIYEHTLRWQGDNGLYQKYHANWVRFLEKTSLHLFEMKLAYTDIANIDLTKRYNQKNTI